MIFWPIRWILPLCPFSSAPAWCWHVSLTLHAKSARGRSHLSCQETFLGQPKSNLPVVSYYFLVSLGNSKLVFSCHSFLNSRPMQLYFWFAGSQILVARTSESCRCPQAWSHFSPCLVVFWRYEPILSRVRCLHYNRRISLARDFALAWKEDHYATSETSFSDSFCVFHSLV